MPLGRPNYMSLARVFMMTGTSQQNTNHDAVSQDIWSRVCLVGTLYHKVIADQSVPLHQLHPLL